MQLVVARQSEEGVVDQLRAHAAALPAQMLLAHTPLLTWQVEGAGKNQTCHVSVHPADPTTKALLGLTQPCQVSIPVTARQW